MQPENKITPDSAIIYNNFEKRNLISNFTVAASAYVLSVLFNLTATSLLTRLLGPITYGKLSLFFMMATCATTFLINWPNASLICFGKEAYLTKNNFAFIFWPRLMLWFISIVVSGFVFFTMNPYIKSYIQWEFSLIPWLLLLFVICSSLYELLSNMLQTIGRQRVAGVMPLVSKIGLLSAIALFFCFFNNLSLTPAVISYIIALTITIAIALPFFHFKSIFPFQINTNNMRAIIGLTWAIPIGAISTYIINWVDVIVIKHFLGFAPVGIYSLAYNGFFLFNTIIITSINLTFSFIIILKIEQNIPLIKQYLDHFMPILVLLWSVFISLCALFAPEYVPLIFGKAYSNAVFPFLILLIGIVHNSIGCLYSGITNAYKLITPITLLSVCMVILNLIGDLLLVPHWGIIGAAAATSLSIVITNIFIITVTNHSKIVDSHSSRYAIHYAVLPFYITFIIIMACDSIVLRLISFVVFLSILFLITKKINLFKEEDIVLIQKFSLPPKIKNTLISFYSFLAKD